jgi:hypothetical protein
VLRSAAAGTMVVHHRLNAGRAITLCCTEKSASSARFTANATPKDTSRGESMDFGTHRLPMKPTA